MNTIAEALNTLVAAVNVAHEKGGVYSLQEAHHIYLAIDYLNSLSQEQEAPAAQVAPVVEEVPQEAPAAPEGPQNMEYTPEG